MNAIYDYLITKQKIREKMQQQGKVSICKQRLMNFLTASCDPQDSFTFLLFYLDLSICLSVYLPAFISLSNFLPSRPLSYHHPLVCASSHA